MLQRLRLLTAAAAATLATGAALGFAPAPAAASSCDLHYVASGDDVPNGNDASKDEAYPTQLLNDHLVPSPGTWCLYGNPSNGLTSSQYISDGEMSYAFNMAPDLITLSVGEQNSGIEPIIDDCFSDVESHDFSGALECATQAYGSDAYDGLTHDLTTILNSYKTIMAGRPRLVVVVVGYPDPYPSESSAEENAIELCSPLVDTELTCEERWQQFPPALAMIDQVFQKLNSTISKAVQPFADGYGGRFIFVDPTSAFADHCMTMDVSIQTQVSHGDDVEEEDSDQGFGCDSSWFSSHGDGNFDPPTYLEPAESGVLVGEEQETTGMGVFPNSDGQKCIADLVWEASKIKLGVPQAPADEVCDQPNDNTSDITLDPTGAGAGEASAGGASPFATRVATSPAHKRHHRRRHTHHRRRTHSRHTHRSRHTHHRRQSRQLRRR